MADIEKVIKAIDICLGHGKCDDCGYRIKGGYSTMDCRKPMMRDALALLKEQEPVKPNGTRKGMSFAFNGMLTGYCPRCETIVNSVGNSGACGKCGQKLDWFCADGEQKPTQTNAKNNALDVR